MRKKKKRGGEGEEKGLTGAGKGGGASLLIEEGEGRKRNGQQSPKRRKKKKTRESDSTLAPRVRDVALPSKRKKKGKAGSGKQQPFRSREGKRGMQLYCRRGKNFVPNVDFRGREGKKKTGGEVRA